MTNSFDWIHSLSWKIRNNYGITFTESREWGSIIYNFYFLLQKENYEPKSEIEMWVKKGYNERGLPK